MKKLLTILLLLMLTLVLFLVSCGQDDDYEPYEEEATQPNYEPIPEPTPEPTPSPTPEPTPEPEPEIPEEHISSIPIDEATRLINLLQDIIDEDDSELWGTNISAPFMFVDWETHHVVANQQDNQGRLIREGDLYVGMLPGTQNFFGSPFSFGGTEWGVSFWSNVYFAYFDDTSMLFHMLNATFNAAQGEIIEGSPRGLTHVFFSDTSETRILIHLEHRALLRAIRSETYAERLAALNDALSIRNEREERVLLGRGDREMEIISGTALYTSLMLGLETHEERIQVIENTMIGIKENLTRINHGNTIGVVYAFFLSELGADWKTDISYETDLGYLLQEALGIEELTPFNELDLEIYGYSYVTTREAERLEARLRRREYIMYTVGMSRLLLTIDNIGSFDESSSIEEFTINRELYWYGDLIHTNEAGRLTLQNGIVWIDNSSNEIRIPIGDGDITIEENRVLGHNWELELNAGFEIFEILGGFRIRRARD